MKTPVTFSAPSASTATDAVERRVDAARDAEHDPLEPVLPDVVAGAEDEGLVDLRFTGGVCTVRDWSGGRAGSGTGFSSTIGIGSSGSSRCASSRLRGSLAARRRPRRGRCRARRGPPRRPWPPRARRPARADRLLPSKTSSSCPPTEFTNASTETASWARVASMRSRATDLPMWYGDDERLDHEVGVAVDRELVQARGVPDVLADVHAERQGAAPADEGGSGPAGSSASRRRRRSWGGASCGRPPRSRRRAAIAAAL